eukprot:maker-scaffold14_size734282-snap-gene-6.27 protein:Tk11316 transcript:maker-scaffold14_size734282-snap-gene-6.27-mRNA-1 annotation:"aldehyde oxidase-like"
MAINYYEMLHGDIPRDPIPYWVICKCLAYRLGRFLWWMLDFIIFFYLLLLTYFSALPSLLDKWGSEEESLNAFQVNTDGPIEPHSPDGMVTFQQIIPYPYTISHRFQEGTDELRVVKSPISAGYISKVLMSQFGFILGILGMLLVVYLQVKDLKRRWILRNMNTSRRAARRHHRSNGGLFSPDKQTTDYGFIDAPPKAVSEANVKLAVSSDALNMAQPLKQLYEPPPPYSGPEISHSHLINTRDSSASNKSQDSGIDSIEKQHGRMSTSEKIPNCSTSTSSSSSPGSDSRSSGIGGGVVIRNHRHNTPMERMDPAKRHSEYLNDVVDKFPQLWVKRDRASCNVGSRLQESGVNLQEQTKPNRNSMIINEDYYYRHTQMRPQPGIHGQLRPQGKAITTVDGLGTPKDSHPIQEPIHKAHGILWGFCTPGMVMSMNSMVKSIPDIKDVGWCHQGKLCRFTGYCPILDGFETFCEKPNPVNETCESDEAVLSLKPEQYKSYNSECDPK